MHTFRAIIFGAALVLSGCSETVVTIDNRSSMILSNVVVSGSGFTNRFESIAAGAGQRFAVRTGDSGLRVAFDAGNQKIDTGEQGYFEAGYRVSAVISTNLTVSVSSDF